MAKNQIEMPLNSVTFPHTVYFKSQSLIFWRAEVLKWSKMAFKMAKIKIQHNIVNVYCTV